MTLALTANDGELEYLRCDVEQATMYGMLIRHTGGEPA
jgi:hypothetical protein